MKERLERIEMIEDKLTPDQRLRLECLAQAVIATNRNFESTSESIIEVADEFEKFVRRGK